MSDFIPGQRWVSVADLQLGLGTVQASDFRTVTLFFQATGETRTYARQTAPLTRVRFSSGDTIRGQQGWTLKVESVSEADGLITYSGNHADGTPAELPEDQLDSSLQLNRPAERLYTGQVDAPRWFELRYQTLQHLNRLAHTELRGLTGGRTSPIPHQLYIAHEVANRYAPRVLLADEVGLGKTIEAGMILHQQLLTERARRVLIVVPESLLHQWLVEMLRRFNLFFSLFDEARCEAIEESTGTDNPFQTEQLVLCSLEFLRTGSHRFEQALDGDWDLLVVDEAHHLQWSPDGASVEYELIERLATRTRGVLLLTATPEQLGKASHYARLRLLDPDRFPDLDSFIAEEQAYEPIADAVEMLFNDEDLDESTQQTLLNTLQEGDNQDLLDILRDTTSTPEAKTGARQALVEHLLDRHGTGRVLFRNTRAAVKGFQDRSLATYPLPLPDAYAAAIATARTTGITDTQLLLSPELLHQSLSGSGGQWINLDPRIDWLIEQLRSLRPAKVLVITASAETAIDISEALRIKAGIHAALFHEHLSLVERDRAAAYFADLEYGTQILVCSEIGSEGRNFQFAHHLVLFDLPLNPDLLEQRIGRLDRIGQTETISIHAPYLEGSAQAVMLDWYHQGLSAFEHTCPAGHSVFVQVEAMLIEALHQADSAPEDLDSLISTTRQLHQQLNDALHRGRDRLLEYNSCRPAIAEALREQALREDAESDLWAYLEMLFDCYGIESEEHSEHCHIIRPGDHMQASGFPGLQEDGMTITCDRSIALANEDLHFLTWEHPLVTGAMELVTSNEQGNTTLVTVKSPNVKPGTLLLECIYVMESASSMALQSSRYLPPTSLRVLVDMQGNDHATALPHDRINQASDKVPKDTALKVIQGYSEALRKMVAAAEQHAGRQAPHLLEDAQQKSLQILQHEIDRLRALSQVNATVRREEIEFFETQLAELGRAIASTTPRLDALRVIVTV